MPMHSYHPYPHALVAFGHNRRPTTFDAAFEHPGNGVEARLSNDVYRLGRSDWAVADRSLSGADRDATVTLAINGKSLVHFDLDDQLRTGTTAAVAKLRTLAHSWTSCRATALRACRRLPDNWA